MSPLGPRVLPVLYTRGFVFTKLSISIDEANGGGLVPSIDSNPSCDQDSFWSNLLASKDVSAAST